MVFIAAQRASKPRRTSRDRSQCKRGSRPQSGFHMSGMDNASQMLRTTIEVTIHTSPLLRKC
eukprot:2078380-Rhodomonas_salina.8